jgi:hypothetical protein
MHGEIGMQEGYHQGVEIGDAGIEQPNHVAIQAGVAQYHIGHRIQTITIGWSDTGGQATLS